MKMKGMLMKFRGQKEKETLRLIKQIEERLGNNQENRLEEEELIKKKTKLEGSQDKLIKKSVYQFH